MADRILTPEEISALHGQPTSPVKSIAVVADLARTALAAMAETERLRVAVERITRYPTETAREALMQNIAAAALEGDSRG